MEEIKQLASQHAEIEDLIIAFMKASLVKVDDAKALKTISGYMNAAVASKKRLQKIMFDHEENNLFAAKEVKLVEEEDEEKEVEAPKRVRQRVVKK
jgi:hypothetical protein